LGIVQCGIKFFAGRHLFFKTARVSKSRRVWGQGFGGFAMLGESGMARSG
jgi:hypothetical protein